jgi:hypothetical protein
LRALEPESINFILHQTAKDSFEPDYFMSFLYPTALVYL